LQKQHKLYLTFCISKFQKVGKFAASIEHPKAKSVSASGGLCPLTKGSSPGSRCQNLQTPIIRALQLDFEVGLQLYSTGTDLCCWTSCTGAAGAGTEFWMTTVPVKPAAGWQRNGNVCGRKVTRPSAELCMAKLFMTTTKWNLLMIQISHNKQ